MNIRTTIAIIGAGPAGLAAAAATGDVPAIVIDDNPRSGGQIWRADRGKIPASAARILDKINRNGNVRFLDSTQVFAIRNNSLFAESDDGAVRIEFENLIIAAGAREFFLPFPGWTLPGVFGAGGLQALVKGGVDVRNKRIVVAGTGPLLLAVADFLRRKGARVDVIAEQTSRRRAIGFACGLWCFPGKLAEAFRIGSSLAGTRIRFDSFVTRAFGDSRLEAVAVRTGSREEKIECDFLACGFHLEANTEIAEAAGCGIGDDAVLTDENQRTTVAGIYAAGESAGVGGVELALIEGEIAGLAAAGEDVPDALRRQRTRYRGFANRLNAAFALRPELRSLADADTIVCRCEDVSFGELTRFKDFRSAKLQTRCGMGSCQGRVCGSATRFLFSWSRKNVRPPLFPVRAATLSELSEE